MLYPLSPLCQFQCGCLGTQEKAQCLRNEITSFLNKGAVEELDTATLSPGFYSRIFMVPKKDGTFRPVFDLKSLNVYVRKEKFKMTTPRAVTHVLHKGDWVVSVDLKDAYFHVPIHRKSRRLLRFAVEGSDGVRAFQFRALPFGLTSAPRVFTKVILPIGHLAHVHAVCLLQYLDDWIVRNTDKLLLQQQAKWLLWVLCRVGLVLNAQKSQLVPTQRLIHIGVEYHLDVGLTFPPTDRVLRIEQKVSFLLSAQVTTAYFWLSLPGIMSSATDAIPLGRLHPRPLQFYLLAHWKPASRILSSLVPVKHDLIDHHLRWWLDRECTRAGMILDVPEAQVTLFTDASGSGWGAHVNQFQASEVWSPREGILHINGLEMLAVRKSLTAFRTQLAGLTVQLMSDNATVVSYLSKQGGTVSMNLYSLAREVLLLARDLHIFLLVKHIPGDRNALADLLSRKDKVVHTEWTLVQSVVDTIFNIWDKPNVDLFATRLNNRLPVFVSPMADPLAVDVDAMSITWREMYAYAFPHVGSCRSGDRQDPTRSSVRADTDRSQMAQSVLVRQTIGASDRPSFGPAPQERSVESATQPPATSITPGSVPTRLETVQRSLQEKGFSRAAAEQTSRGHRQSSRAVYDSKWRIFAGWCRDRSVDPFQICVHELEEFFLFLFHEKGLNPMTIKGYRSAISSTISSCGSRSEITSSVEITSLICSFQLERPPKRKITPQ